MAIVVTEVKYPQYPKGLHEAIAEAERLEADPKTKWYTDMNEMWMDLDK